MFRVSIKVRVNVGVRAIGMPEYTHSGDFGPSDLQSIGPSVYIGTFSKLGFGL